MTKAHVGSGDLHRTMELLWNPEPESTGPSKPGPKRKLTLEQVVRAGVVVADRDGLDALSMRNVAAELGIGTMSLYRYVPGKGELLDVMVDHMQAPTGGDLDEVRRRSWREAMEHMAEGIWTLYTSHPWLLQVNQSRPVLGPSSIAGVDAVMGTFEGTGLPDRLKMSIIVAVSNLVTGTAREEVLWQQASQDSGMSDREFWDAQFPYLERAMKSGDYPVMATMDEDCFSTPGIEVMRYGLRAMLDGFEAMLANGTQTPA